MGTYVWRAADDATTYVRFAFSGSIGEPDADRVLDEGIIARHWLSRGALLEHDVPLRNPMVLRCIDDFLAGTRYPLASITHWDLKDPGAVLQAIPAVPVANTGG